MLEVNMYALFGEIERGQTPMGENISYVLQIIKRKGIMGRTELLRRVVAKGVTAAMVSEAIDSLKMGGFIVEKRDAESGISGRPGTVYQYTKGEKYGEAKDGPEDIQGDSQDSDSG
jgi:predicted ArsR family transcriptional regulator